MFGEGRFFGYFEPGPHQGKLVRSNRLIKNLGDDSLAFVARLCELPPCQQSHFRWSVHGSRNPKLRLAVHCLNTIYIFANDMERMDHSLAGGGYNSEILLRMISLSSLPSFSKLRIPWERRSVASLLLFISYLKLSSEASIAAMSISFAFAGLSFTATSPPLTRSSYSKVGEMVSLSQPQSSFISPVLRKEAPMTMVLMPKNL